MKEEKIKKLFALLASVFLVFSLAACGNSSKPASGGSNVQPSASTAEVKLNPGKTIVVYFSATGNTEKVATTISKVSGGTLVKIEPSQPYTDADLNYSNKQSRSTTEQNDPKVRPGITNKIDNWGNYDTVFVGFPIWWYEEPRIMDTFMESYDFSGKTVIPFCTSGGSDIENAEVNLKALSKGQGKWLKGRQMSSSISEKDVSDWLKSLGLM